LVAVAAAAWLVSSGSARPGATSPQQPPPPKDEPEYTAFPDLKTPAADAPRGPDPAKLFGRLTRGHPRPVPADAPPLRKVKLAQLNEGAEFLLRSHKGLHNQNQGWRPAVSLDSIRVTAEDAYRLGAELAEGPAEKVGWHEDRVVVLKWLEQLAEARMQTGTDPPQDLNRMRFYRLQAEADLLEMKAGKK
jgi:hypothetical protein